MNTIKIIIHGTGTMSSILKNVIEAEEDLEVSGFADDLSNEKGDIIIDFSHFSRIPNMLNFAVNNNIPIVICTTGYDDKILSQIKEASSKIPILLSSNTSIGINLMNDLVSKMAENLNGFDIEIIETHHNKKVDSPSGTAKTLFNVINQTLENKMNLINGREGNHKRDKCQNSMYDFPFVELNHLAMQPIYGAELLCASSKKPKSTDNGKTLTATEDDTSATIHNNRILGFATNFSWYTEKRAKVSGLFIQEQYYDDKGVVKTKENLYNWTEARFFSIDDGKRPIINNDFLQCKMDNRNYQIVDESIERAQFMVWHNNIVDSWRSMSSKRLPSMLGVTEGLK